MKGFAIVAALLLSAAAARAEWPLEPKDFRGVHFGASQAEATAVLKNSAGIGVLQGGKFGGWNCLDGTRCFVSAPIGRFTTDQDFTFYDDKFVQVKLTFATEAFDELRAIFIERYGPPTDERKAAVKTQAGGTFTNDVVTWSGERVIVRIERYFTSLDTGFAIVADRAWSEAEEKRRADERKRAAASF